MESLSNKKPEPSITERLRSRAAQNEKSRESVKKIAEGVQNILEQMENNGMNELHMGYALIQAGFGHKFVQDYLKNGAFMFFVDNGDVFDKVGFEKIMKIIENFDFDRDKEKALVGAE